jgi:hypothetical protein
MNKELQEIIEDEEAEKLAEKATKQIWLTPRTKAYFKKTMGRDHPEDSASQFQNRLLDLWNETKRKEEAGED